MAQAFEKPKYIETDIDGKPRLLRTNVYNTLLKELKRVRYINVLMQDESGEEVNVRLLSLDDDKYKTLVGGGASPSPFDMTVTAGDVTFYPGTIDALLPTNIFSTLSVSMTGTWYVIATASATTAQITSVVLSISATPPSSHANAANMPPATAEILIGVIVDGEPFNALGRSVSLNSTLRYRAEKPSPAGPGETPWIYYYGWGISS